MDCIWIGNVGLFVTTRNLNANRNAGLAGRKTFTSGNWLQEGVSGPATIAHRNRVEDQNEIKLTLLIGRA